MSEWAPKRFWTEVHVKAEEGEWAVLLDDRPLRTPAKAQLRAPTQALADRVADEWRAQEDTVDPGSMPFTRSLNATLDKVIPNPGPVAEMLANYAETDLLCYRATEPSELVARQTKVWDPYLRWAADIYGAELVTTQGIMPVAQPEAATHALATAVSGLDPFDLTSAHDLVTLSGSLVLGLAAISGRIDGESLWTASRLDELWQIEQWGEDDEAEALAATKRQAILHALAFQAAAKAIA